eukprot:1235448-Ditylum_brightwellii.AAC.1
MEQAASSEMRNGLLLEAKKNEFSGRHIAEDKSNTHSVMWLAVIDLIMISRGLVSRRDIIEEKK